MFTFGFSIILAASLSLTSSFHNTESFQLVRRCLDSVHLSGKNNRYGLLLLALLLKLCIQGNVQFARLIRLLFYVHCKQSLLVPLLFLIRCFMAGLWMNLIFIFHHLIFVVVCVRYFIATNATSTFRSIVSSYPGKLILVSIQVKNIFILYYLLLLCIPNSY